MFYRRSIDDFFSIKCFRQFEIIEKTRSNWLQEIKDNKKKKAARFYDLDTVNVDNKKRYFPIELKLR